MLVLETVVQSPTPQKKEDKRKTDFIGGFCLHKLGILKFRLHVHAPENEVALLESQLTVRFFGSMNWSH